MELYILYIIIFCYNDFFIKISYSIYYNECKFMLYNCVLKNMILLEDAYIFIKDISRNTCGIEFLLCKLVLSCTYIFFNFVAKVVRSI